MTRRRRRRLRRIADLEARLGIWPPWHFVRTPFYDPCMADAGFVYRLPRQGDTGHAVAWSEVADLTVRWPLTLAATAATVAEPTRD